jgi:drug/metabolite transporter (DMT)-like permease
MNPFDILMILVNGLGWGIKPITEKKAVTKIGHQNFSYIRYIVTALIATPLLIYNLQTKGGFKALIKKNPNFYYDAAYHGFVVSVVALASICANYYLLSKYPVSMIAPIVEGMLLVFNVGFGALLLGEKITWNIIAGVSLIITGVFVCYMK